MTAIGEVMPEYRVTWDTGVSLSLTVEAEDEVDAEDIAYERVQSVLNLGPIDGVLISGSIDGMEAESVVEQ